MTCNVLVNIIPTITSSVLKLSNFAIKANLNTFQTCSRVRLNFVPVSKLHTTCPCLDLMEFFDNEKNWGQDEVRVGRAWRKEELRVKSNSDLHKLWYVLLKERNMLMTMEHECNKELEIFANPERLDKVKESMHNLEEVVMERNRAYHQLETGETGERPCKIVHNQFGLKTFYKMTEHLIPKKFNKKWHETHVHNYNRKETSTFLSLYREKLFVAKQREKRRVERHVYGLLRNFPNIDNQYLKELYPDMNIDKMKTSKKAKGTGEHLL